MDEARPTTTVDEFLDSIERKKYDWFDVYQTRPTNRTTVDRRPMQQDFSKRGPSQRPPYGYNPRPSHTPNARTSYRLNTPYRPYYKNRPYADEITRQDVQPSIERPVHYNLNRNQPRALYNSTPWNQRRFDSLKGPSQILSFRPSVTPGQRETSGPLTPSNPLSNRTLLC